MKPLRVKAECRVILDAGASTLESIVCVCARVRSCDVHVSAPLSLEFQTLDFSVI